MEWDTIKKKKTERRTMTPEEAVMAAWTAEAMCIEQKQKTKSEYRASAMPLCTHYMATHKGKNEIVNGQTGFYTSVGTALHEFLQDRFPQTKNGMQVWGDWQCQNHNCQAVYKHRAFPGRCEKCGGQLRYKEVEVLYRGTISMHIDLLLLQPSGRFWLNDWKTCSTFVAENPHLVGLPYAKNVQQVETYAVALWVEHKIHVEHIFLDYVLRGEPEDDVLKPKNQPYGFKVTRDLLAARKAQMDRIVEEKLALERFEKHRTLDNLKRFDNLRPCHTAQDYKERRYGMEAGFKYHAEKGCPFANIDGCFKRGLSEPAKIIARNLAKVPK